MSAIDTKVRVQMDWRGDEYLSAVRRASQEAVKEAAKLVARSARKLAPVAKKHRVWRTYPSGTTFADVKPLRRGIRTSVRWRRDRALGLVRSVQGYSVFQEYGTVNQPARSYLRAALAMNAHRLIPILKSKTAKETAKGFRVTRLGAIEVK